MGRRFKSLKIVGVSFVFRVLLLGVFFGICVGRTSHPSLGFFLFLLSLFSLLYLFFFNIIFFVSDQKKKYGKARAFLQEQEHAFKSGQLGKGRKRRR